MFSIEFMFIRKSPLEVAFFICNLGSKTGFDSCRRIYDIVKIKLL